MRSDESIQLLERLSLAAAPPGAEDEARAIVHEQLNGIGTLSHDALGSVICELPGNSDAPRIVLDSHLDEVGFMVQSIDDEGRLAMVALGGWWGHVLLGQAVEILSGQGKRHGIIGSTPPHFLPKERRDQVLSIEQMYIDVGARSRAEAEQLGLRVGDPVVPSAPFGPMPAENVFRGKALDNRIGVALMCRTLRALSEQSDPRPNTIIGVGAVQEEVGLRGAQTATSVAQPDLALVLECTPADDLPGQTARQACLGAGPQIRLFDPTAISNRRLVRWIEELAEELELPLQRAVRRSGGTDAGSIHRVGRGVPTVVIGVPARYIHTHAALMHRHDFEIAEQLLLAATQRLDRAAVDSFTNFNGTAD